MPPEVQREHQYDFFLREHLDHLVDLVLDGGAVGLEPTTVINLTGDTPVLVRRGKGDITPFFIEDYFAD